MAVSRPAPDVVNRTIRSPIAWGLFVCLVVGTGWIASRAEWIASLWDRPSRREVINGAREFVELIDRSQIARPGLWHSEYEGVPTTPPPSDPTYRVEELGGRRWAVQGVVIVHDTLGERRLQWNMRLSRERSEWFCERAEIGADDATPSGRPSP